jgi:hypothetical protein
MDCRICRAPGICICEPAPPSAPPAARDMAGETVLGFRVAAYRETHPEHGDKFGHSYSEHWSTPNTRDPRVKVERLFTEDQLREALRLSAPPAPADVAALLEDLHELDWGALPAVGRAAAAIEALMARVATIEQQFAETVERIGDDMRHHIEHRDANRRRAEAAEAPIAEAEQTAKDAKEMWGVQHDDLKRAIARAEAVEKALLPFAEIAQHDICDTDADTDLFLPMHKYNRGPKLTVGLFRAARAALPEKGGEPSP